MLISLNASLDALGFFCAINILYLLGVGGTPQIIKEIALYNSRQLSHGLYFINNGVRVRTETLTTPFAPC